MPQATFSIIASLKFLRIAYDFLKLLRQSYKTRTLPKTPHPLRYLIPSSSNSTTLFFNAAFSNSNILIRA